MDDEGLEVDGESLVRHILFSIGEQPMSGGGGPGDSAGSSGSHVAEVSMAIQSGDQRPISAAEIERRWRALTPAIPGVVELVFSADLFSPGDPVDIQLRSNNVSQLREAADRLKQRLGQFAGV